MARTRLLAVAICATALGSFIAPRNAAAQATADSSCAGVVFDDVDLDGAFGDTERGVAGVTVTVTDRTGHRTTTSTDGDGAWRADVGASRFPIRIEFESPDGTFPAGVGANNGSTVQFARSPDDCDGAPTGSFGLYVPGAACRLHTTLVTGCYLSADSPNYDDAAAIELVSPETFDTGAVDGSSQADWLSPAPAPLATNGDIGAIYGLATDPRGTVYAAAFVKRHTRLDAHLNPVGNPTTIYRIRPGQAPEAFVTIDPEATNPHDLTEDPRDDAAVFDDVFQTGLGDLDVSADGTTMYTVDLGRRELVVLSLPSGRIDARLPLTGEALGIEDCAVSTRRPAGDLRAFGLGFDDQGGLLIGVVCSAASTVPRGDVIDERETPNRVLGDPAALVGYVFELVDDHFVQRLAWPLAADRGDTRDNGMVSNDAAWHPWVPGIPFRDEHDVVSYPQPAITDLTVDAAGNLVIALGDRWGHQTMPESSAPTTDGRSYDIVETVIAGDLQRACHDGQTWHIEGTEGCSGGWGNGFEFFDGDSYGWHAETTLGSVVAMPAADETDRSILVATQMDPRPGERDPWRSGGLAWHDSTNGAYLRGARLYDGRHADPDYTFEKASGIADLALLCDAAPLQVGGRMWHDLDADGEQDAAEPAIRDVRVELRDVDGNVLATVASDARGNYLFDAETSGGRLVEGQEYLITIASWNFEHGPFSRTGTHTGLRPTTRDPAIRHEVDSDGRVGGEHTVVPDLTFASTVVGDDPTTDTLEGAADISVDFGFRDQYDLAIATTWVRNEDVLGVLAFQTVVHNQGSEPSGAFEFVDRFPYGTTLVAASQGSERTGAGESVLRWSVGVDDQLLPGESRVYTVLVHVDDESQSPFVNAVQITADSGDDDDSEPGNADLDVVLDRDETYLDDHGLLDDNGGATVEDDTDSTIVQLHQITGRLWIDPDHDARYEPDQPDVDTTLAERAVAGVAVVLRHRDGTEIERQWTGHDGTYEFTMVPSDDYVIEIPTDEFEVGRPLGGYDWMSSSYRSGLIDTDVGVRIPLSLEAGTGGAHVVDLAIAHRPTRSWLGWFRVEMLLPGLALIVLALLIAQRHANRAAAVA